jgi:DNA-directed RNA polymerase specialized sigma24 family protein
MKNRMEVIWPAHKIQKRMDQQVQSDYLKESSKNEEVTFSKLKLNDLESEIVREKVANLPTGELAVIYLKFWEGLCEYEISKALCISTGAVKKMLSSALERLRNDFIHLQEPECA